MAQLLKYLILAIYQYHFVTVCFTQEYIGDDCKDSQTGDDGICSLIPDCPDIITELRSGVKPTNCGFQGKDPIVCCPKIRPAKEMCEKISLLCPAYTAVVGGEKVQEGELPYIAAIGYGDQNNISWGCGGTLISETFVLTAAHCLSSANVGPAQWVLLGTEVLIDSTKSNGSRGQIHPVMRRIRHPEYKPPSKYNDVALLEIGPTDSPNALPTFGKDLHPACLTTEEDTFSNSIAAGWGRVGFAEDPSPELLKVELNVIDSGECNKSYEVEIKTTKLLQNGIDSTMLCAGVMEGGKDTCQGDSGGPLYQVLQVGCLHRVLGITSFGKVCGFSNSPAVYMRVFAYVPWIESIVWRS